MTTIAPHNQPSGQNKPQNDEPSKSLKRKIETERRVEAEVNIDTLKYTIKSKTEIGNQVYKMAEK